MAKHTLWWNVQRLVQDVVFGNGFIALTVFIAVIGVVVVARVTKAGSL